jgi:hypothetical protein
MDAVSGCYLGYKDEFCVLSDRTSHLLSFIVCRTNTEGIAPNKEDPYGTVSKHTVAKSGT